MFRHHDFLACEGICLVVEVKELAVTTRDFFVNTFFKVSGISQKADCGFHDSRLKFRILLFCVFSFYIFEICHAESAADCVNMKIGVIMPLLIESVEKKCADSASLGTTESLHFPYIGQEVLELLRRRLVRK